MLTAEVLAEIYRMVGGLPLALKLLAAQMCKLPVAQVLHGLQSSQRLASETLYRYIYQRTWSLLNDPARSLLLSMLDISPDGEDLEWLQMTNDLTDRIFETALSQLIDHSLLEVNGPLDTPIYKLHRLTIVFLQTDILHRWQTGKDQ